jgi:hypothetical protein
VGSSELKFKSAWSTGFRAPSLYEIAYNRSFFASPPAAGFNLQEERSEGLDIGVAWYGASGLVLEAIVFEQTVEDEIFFDLVAYSGYLQGSGDILRRAQNAGVIAHPGLHLVPDGAHVQRAASPQDPFDLAQGLFQRFADGPVRRGPGPPACCDMFGHAGSQNLSCVERGPPRGA